MTPTYTQTDWRQGTGRCESGQTTTVNYTGRLDLETASEQKRAKFDSSIGRGRFAFKLGAGQVIRRWDQRVQGAVIHTFRLSS